MQNQNKSKQAISSIKGNSSVTPQSLLRMREIIIAETWQEIQLDCTERVNNLTDDQVLNEYNFIMTLSGWN